MKLAGLSFPFPICTVRRVEAIGGPIRLKVTVRCLRMLGGALPLVALASVSCSDGEEGEGSVVVSAYGESFIEEGIPSSEVSDGWQIRFDRFEVSFAEINLGGRMLQGTEPVDLAEDSQGNGQELGALLLAEGMYAQPSFVIGRMEIEGSASRGEESKAFHWTFDEAVTYEHCETITTVVEGQNSFFQLTVHADHLFYDSLVAPEPKLTFGPLAAADEDGDGEITARELERQDIGAYDPGNEDGIDDLWAWLRAQARTLGHVDGEGHCHVAHEE